MIKFISYFSLIFVFFASAFMPVYALEEHSSVDVVSSDSIPESTEDSSATLENIENYCKILCFFAIIFFVYFAFVLAWRFIRFIMPI